LVENGRGLELGAEGAIAITAGILAGSIALISAIEGLGFASLVIVWRFTGWRLLSHAAEERAQKLVAIQFFFLAPYVTFEALHTLVAGDKPQASWVGVALVTSSVRCSASGGSTPPPHWWSPRSRLKRAARPGAAKAAAPAADATVLLQRDRAVRTYL
jgi:hypothetical protein